MEAYGKNHFAFTVNAFTAVDKSLSTAYATARSVTGKTLVSAATKASIRSEPDHVLLVVSDGVPKSRADVPVRIRALSKFVSKLRPTTTTNAAQAITKASHTYTMHVTLTCSP